MVTLCSGKHKDFWVLHKLLSYFSAIIFSLLSKRKSAFFGHLIAYLIYRFKKSMSSLGKTFFSTLFGAPKMAE